MFYVPGIRGICILLSPCHIGAFRLSFIICYPDIFNLFFIVSSPCTVLLPFILYGFHTLPFVFIKCPLPILCTICALYYVMIPVHFHIFLCFHLLCLIYSIGEMYGRLGHI